MDRPDFAKVAEAIYDSLGRGGMAKAGECIAADIRSMKSSTENRGGRG